MKEKKQNERNSGEDGKGISYSMGIISVILS